MVQMNQIIGMIKNGQNPQQVMMNLLQGMQNTPMGVNLLNLAKNNRSAEIEQIARNLMREQGKDFDTEFQAFRRKYGQQFMLLCLVIMSI